MSWEQTCPGNIKGYLQSQGVNERSWRALQLLAIFPELPFHAAYLYAHSGCPSAQLTAGQRHPKGAGVVKD